MKKLLFGIILCLISSISFVLSFIKCYYLFLTIVFMLTGLFMLGGLFVLRHYTTNKEQRRLMNVLLGVSIFFAIAAVVSVYYAYDKDGGGKVSHYITDKLTEKELGLLVAEYRQVNHVNFDNIDIHGDMHVAYQSRYSVFNDKSKIDVYPDLYNCIIYLRGDKVVYLFDWRNNNLDISEGVVELTTIRNNDECKPEFITGSIEMVDSIKTLPDTVTFHIFNCKKKKDVDSLIFVKNKAFNNLSVRKGYEEYCITRKRSFVDRIKDLYLID